MLYLHLQEVIFYLLVLYLNTKCDVTFESFYKSFDFIISTKKYLYRVLIAYAQAILLVYDIT